MELLELVISAFVFPLMSAILLLFECASVFIQSTSLSIGKLWTGKQGSWIAPVPGSVTVMGAHFCSHLLV